MRKKLPILYPKQRTVLSDVLPYEAPLTFSNRYFYRYLIKREHAQQSEDFRTKHVKAFAEIESILFAVDARTSPFCFVINHKKTDFRTLNVIHPSNQVKVLDFYEKYKSLIIYYCSISPFSIRRPTSIAKFTFYNDMLHQRTQDGNLEHAQVEQDEYEYENLKSYFTYQKYSNIHRFFESYQFHSSEKKYNKLLKIDISKCFDSVYTHTISWALLNKSIVKDNIEFSRKTFGGEFDDLMQKLNANETNGIVIGPEFSRIFAELILQQIDLNVFERLKKGNESHKSLIHKVDYEIFRYVDDYFIFYNQDTEADEILRALKLGIKEYKLHVNDEKSIHYTKPIITEISLAKQKISDLFNEHLSLFILEKEQPEEKSVIHSVYFSSNNVITRFKTIVKETGVEYKDIMNYSLAIIDRKTHVLINKYKSIPEAELKEKMEKQFEKGFLEILDVAFFLYSVSPRVNSTIKLCLIINKMIRFLKKNRSNSYKEPFLPNNKHNVFKKISDEIFLILQKNRTKKETPIETLYLLIALSQLGREYRLNIRNLCEYFNISIAKTGELSYPNELNYFAITVALFYIRDIRQYQPFKDFLKAHIRHRYEQATYLKDWKTNSELVLLLMDVMACPYLDRPLTSHLKGKIERAKLKGPKKLTQYTLEGKNFKYKFKKDLLNLIGVSKNHFQLIEQERYWFTKWTDFDFGMELQSKRSQEVY